MATKINLTYCGMDGAGRTVTEAKQDAARKLERACASHDCGIISTANGEVILVHGGLRTGEYSFARAGQAYMGGCAGNGDFEETAFSACVHALRSFEGIAWTCGIPDRIVKAAREEARKRDERDAPARAAHAIGVFLAQCATAA